MNKLRLIKKTVLYAVFFLERASWVLLNPDVVNSMYSY